MARKASNGAVLSNDGGYYWSGFKWTPLTPQPATKAPGLFSKDAFGLPTYVRGMSAPDLQQKGTELASLIARFGSLKDAEDAYSAGPTAVAAPVMDIPSQIEKLASLRDKGILSAAEFEAKKADLLAKM